MVMATVLQARALIAPLSNRHKRWSLLREALVLLIGVVGIAIAALPVVRGDDTAEEGKPPRVKAAPTLLQFASVQHRIPETLQSVTTMAFSPDGTYLASGHGWHDRDRSIQIWEVETGKRVGVEPFVRGVSSIVWTPDGKRLAAASWDFVVRIYDFPGLREKVRFRVDNSGVRLGISPDGKRIMTAAEGYVPTDDSRGRVVQIWDASTGALVRKCESEDDLFRLGCAAWSPKGKYVAAAGGYFRDRKGLARLWRADTGKEAVRLTGHAAYIQGIRFFPDDDRVATAGFDGTVRIWDTTTGKALTEMNVGSAVNGLDVSRDGGLVATGTSSGALTLWEPENGKWIHDLRTDGSPVHTVAFSPDGKTLASGGADSVISLWNVADRKITRELPAPGEYGRLGRTRAIAPSGDGEFVVVAYDTGTLAGVNIASETVVWKRQSPQNEFPTAIVISPDKKRVLVGYENGAARLHSAAEGAVLLDLQSLPARVSAVALAGELLAAGDTKGRVRLWDQNGKRLRAERQDHQGAVRAVGFAGKGAFIASIGADGTAVCRNTNGDEKSAEARVSEGAVSSAVFSADGSMALVLGTGLTTWDTATLTQRRNVNVIRRDARSLALSSDGSNVLIGYTGATSVEGPNDGNGARSHVAGSGEAGAIALSADNRVLIRGTESGALDVWQALPPRQSPVARIQPGARAVALAASPDGKWLAAGGDDSRLFIWNLETGALTETLAGGSTIYALQFSPDSKLLASATHGAAVDVWATDDWTLKNTRRENRSVKCLAFSPDGRWLATGGTDRTLLITDTETWKTVVEKPNQDRWVEGVAFSADGRRLYSITGSWHPPDQPANSTLTAWDVRRGKDPPELELELVKAVPAHANTSDNLVVTPDSRLVVTASADARIKVWDARTLDLIRTIRALEPTHRIHLSHSHAGLLAAGGHYGGVSLWNIDTGALIANYGGHVVGHVTDVTETMDGRLLVSTGEDGLVLWSGPTPDLNEALRRFIQQVAQPK
jgi:WD40 repeat protein